MAQTGQARLDAGHALRDTAELVRAGGRAADVLPDAPALLRDIVGGDRGRERVERGRGRDRRERDRRRAGGNAAGVAQPPPASPRRGAWRRPRATPPRNRTPRTAAASSAARGRPTAPATGECPAGLRV